VRYGDDYWSLDRTSEEPFVVDAEGGVESCGDREKTHQNSQHKTKLAA